MSKQHVYGQVFLETDDGKYYLYLGNDNYEVITQQAVIDDALNELAEIQTALTTKVDIVPNETLTPNKYTDNDKIIVSTIEQTVESESKTREHTDKYLQTQVNTKANVADITSTIFINYDSLNVDKSSYSNSLLAGKQVVLISNESTTQELLTFDNGGLLQLGFTATPDFTGSLLGSLGTSPNADVFISDLKQAITATEENNFLVADSDGFIGLRFGQNGLETPNVKLNELNIGNNEVKNGVDADLFNIVDPAGYYGFRVDSTGVVHARGFAGVNESKLKGKKVGLMQDSFGVFPRASGGITEQNIWHTKFTEKTGVIFSKIDAQGGTCLSQKTGVQYGLLDSRINSLNGTLYDPEDIDIIILALFTNDFGGQNIQLGTYGSSDFTTWYGALPEGYRKLTTRYKNAKVFHIIGPVRNRYGLENPINTVEKPGYSAYNSTTGFYYDQFADATYKVAPSFGVKLIDMRFKSLITPNNLGTPGATQADYVPNKTEDGLHMLAEAHDDYATVVKDEIELYY